MAGGMNPVAMGILTGSMSGAAMGAMAGGPVGAAVGLVVGASMGAATGSEQQKQIRAQEQQKKQVVRDGINNQNALVQEAYKKKKNAMGIGEAGAIGGEVASQSGTVLTSGVTGGNSILG